MAARHSPCRALKLSAPLLCGTRTWNDVGGRTHTWVDPAHYRYPNSRRCCHEIHRSCRSAVGRTSSKNLRRSNDRTTRGRHGRGGMGLSLEDGKEIVRELQSRIIAVQIEMLEAAYSLCIHCGSRKDLKDRRSRQFRTVFGVVRVRCRRFIFCTCRGGKARNEWPLRHLSRSSTTPELRYLLAKFGSAKGSLASGQPRL
jgi:hypothetical protein